MVLRSCAVCEVVDIQYYIVSCDFCGW
jgi:hypothetical protein